MLVLTMTGGQLQETAAKLRKEDREVGRGRKWRQNYRLLNKEVLLLEEEEKKLELVYPQVDISMFAGISVVCLSCIAQVAARLQVQAYLLLLTCSGPVLQYSLPGWSVNFHSVGLLATRS